MALYRKYRPATFGEVVGQEHVTRPLSVALDTGRINHAYLFSGPRGCGKTSSARILARSLNCEHGPTSTPCGVCNSCRSLAPGGPGNLDVTELDAASHNGVDDMRDLRDRAFYAPAESRYRVFIIDEAHMISTAGSNALLKIVEEPPAHLIFIFATTEPERVIGTIRSRTHHYPFRLLTPSAMRGLLERTCAAEGVYVDDAVFPLVIRAGGGSPRDSLSVLDQLLAGAGPDGLTYDLAVPLLGVTDDTLIDAAIESLAEQDNAGLFVAVDDVIEAGYDPRRFTVDLLDRLRDLMVLQAVPDALSLGLVDAPTDRAGVLSTQAQQFASGSLSRLATLVNDGLTGMRGATSPRLLLEILCAKMLMGEVPPAAVEASKIEAVPKTGSGRVFERRSQRLARERANAEAQAQSEQTPAKPIEVSGQAEVPKTRPAAVAGASQETDAGAPTPAPQVSASTPAPQAVETPAPVEETREDRIRRKWAYVREQVYKANKVAAIMLTEAKVLGIREETLVIGHNTGALAARINDPNNNADIIAVLKSELGYDLRVQCVVGTDPEQAGFNPVSAAPEWKPEAPKPQNQQVMQEPRVSPEPQGVPAAQVHQAPKVAPAQPQVAYPVPQRMPSEATSPANRHQLRDPVQQAPEPAMPQPSQTSPMPRRRQETSRAPEAAQPAAPPAAVWKEPAKLGGQAQPQPEQQPQRPATPQHDVSTTYSDDRYVREYGQRSSVPSNAEAIGGRGAVGASGTSGPGVNAASPGAPGAATFMGSGPKTPEKQEPPRKPKRWEEAAARGNERLRNNPTFSDGVPLPPEPEDPYSYSADEGIPQVDNVPAAEDRQSVRQQNPYGSNGLANASRQRDEEEAAMVEEAITESGTRDHRDAREIAIEMLQQELGARPL
ncbi:MAG: DNA polymerase III subunit gamma and tau [Corynebacterium sp.]|nr:DNA polymerase III subunit gamma and tau [Corynebacterium sp.]